MPIDYKNYPANWSEIRDQILQRENHCCKFCGVPDRSEIIRSVEDSAKYIIFNFEDGVYTYSNGDIIRMSEIPDEFDQVEEHTRIILTIAHLGAPHSDGTPGDPDDKMDVRPENLAALCQRCHLEYDRESNIEKARQTRLANKRQEKIDQGQLTLWEDL